MLALAILAPWLYDRYLAFAPLISNRPGKLKETYNIKSHELKFEKRIRNCEDVVLDEELGVAIISCDPGRDWWNTVMVIDFSFPTLRLKTSFCWLSELV